MPLIVVDMLPTPLPSIGETIVVILGDRRLDPDDVLLKIMGGSMMIARYAGDMLAQRK